ncbi:hypothetical protein DICPUDRAFT_98061 [Dictyostelium purpureum]|uniref:Histidine kinase/HSP90-like ATPase domain-containing protein n=1 Tax=Dictyostelium purpureum TaxID=5786 RepID=F0ZMB9_DICPU|nr:uncharacterized protein DICPUDRAFT_98061 [Dictyostelium purpureum]EGC34917.1 hypothetical protein DICPUDRAFT_98061 [Dictyostelium purpureum]|eukprot:XP_003288550.1 hypothetical protein DICPUDRAFT_98061 [Dictyostelium purpureum]
MRGFTKLFLVFTIFALLFVVFTPSTQANDVTTTNLESDGYTEAEAKLIEEKGEKFTFQTEVNKLMNIIINSLYSKKEIFLRELISNASDALDKIRFLGLTNPSLLGEGEQSKLDVHIKIDKENNVLHITDKGVGMTKDELIKNLGTIAQSGTKEFIQKVSESSDSSNLIGQFGVGFYSLFLVADSVVVTSKSNDDDQYIWTSDSQSQFTIAKDPKGNTLGRGTRISLHIKEDSKEFLEQQTIRELVKKYSQFINFPIFLYTSEEIEVPVEEKEPETKPETTNDEETTTTEEDEDAAEEKEPATEKKTVYKWEELNDAKPLWMKSQSEISKEEYTEFFRSLSKNQETPITYTHFRTETDPIIRSILYIPENPPSNMFDLDAVSSGLKLFVRRVFITDNLKDLVPNWLRFLIGVIDSDDLPLNVSREILQQSKILDSIKKAVVSKFIQMVKSLAEDEDKTNFHNFFKKFGSNVKLGIIEDSKNKNRLIKYLLFPSNKNEFTSFEDYVSRMKEGQDQIYFISGKSKESVEASPLIEQAIKKGYEVLYFVDAIDEYLIPQLDKYDDKYKFTNLARDGVKFDETAEEEESRKQTAEEFKPLTDFLKKTLSDKVEKVTISKVLADSPSILVSNAWGFTGNMERIMKAQAHGQTQPQFNPKKIMEINPSHQLIKQLLSRLVEFGEQDEVVKISANVLYETSALTAGYSIENPTSFADWIYKIMLISGEQIAKADYQSPQQTNTGPQVSFDGNNEMFNQPGEFEYKAEPETQEESVQEEKSSKHDEL